MAAGATFLLLLGLLVASSAALMPRAESGTLFSSWFDLVSTNFTINEIDPNSGTKGNEAFAGQGYAQLFAASAAIDYNRKHVFLSLVASPDLNLSGQAKKQQPLAGSIVGFDLSSATATVLGSVDVPYAYIVSVQYDAVNDKLYVLGIPLQKGSNFTLHFGEVDIHAREYKELLQIEKFFPSSRGVGGDAAALDQKNRLFVSSLMSKQEFFVTTINVDTLEIKHHRQSTYIPLAMAWDRDNGVIYTTLANFARDLGSNTTWGTINPLTGQINAIYQWENRDLVFTVGGISALDAKNKRFYTIMGNGGGPPVALVTVDATNGQILSKAYFHRAQPQSIFVL